MLDLEWLELGEPGDLREWDSVSKLGLGTLKVSGGQPLVAKKPGPLLFCLGKAHKQSNYRPLQSAAVRGC